MALSLKNPEGIFFDWDGTLVDSLGFLTGVHNHVKEHYGLKPFVGDQYLYYLGMPRERIFSEIYGEKADGAKTLFEKHYFETHLSGLIVFEGVIEMLSALQSMDIPMGVVSNKKTDFLQAEIKHLGWQKFFGDCIVGAGDAPRDKPSADPLLLALNKKNAVINQNNIWYIGDTEIDVMCADETGCQCIIIHTEESQISEKLDKKPVKEPVFVKKYEEICGFLLQSEKKTLKQTMNN